MGTVHSTPRLTGMPFIHNDAVVDSPDRLKTASNKHEIRHINLFGSDCCCAFAWTA